MCRHKEEINPKELVGRFQLWGDKDQFGYLAPNWGCHSCNNRNGEYATMPKSTEQREDVAALNEEVRGYFRECQKITSIRRVMNTIDAAKLELHQQTETVRKHLRSRDALGDLHDLKKLQVFFTKHTDGMRLRGVAVPSVGQYASIHTSSWADRIGQGLLVRPIAPTALASLRIRGLKWGRGTVSVELGLYCGVIDGVALQRGMIALDPHPGSMVRDHRDTWNKDRIHITNIKGRESSIVLKCHGSEHNPVWEVDGLGQPIGNWVYPAFANLEGLSPGDAVKATFSTWLAEMGHFDVINDAGQSAPSARIDDDLLEVDNEGKPLPEMSQKKQRIIWIRRQKSQNLSPNSG